MVNMNTIKGIRYRPEDADRLGLKTEPKSDPALTLAQTTEPVVPETTEPVVPETTEPVVPETTDEKQATPQNKARAPRNKAAGA